MKKNISYSSITILLLAVAVVVMSVGFATFSADLNITGTTTLAGASWNVAFDEGSYEESAGSVVASNKIISANSMSYSATLSKPGEFYEFTIDSVNSGTFNAKLSGITMTTLTTEQSKYLTYKVYYDGTEYTASKTGLSVPLNSGADTSVKVRVEYVQPANASDLPATEQKITLDASFSYVQVSA